MDEYFNGFETSYFSEGIKKLAERWTKCVMSKEIMFKNKK